MTFQAPIGIDDFVELRSRGLAYVDKTAWVSEWLRDSSKVSLFPRPRRFGKTLNLSTLRTFLALGDDAPARARLFEGLAIANDLEAKPHFARYPVIHFSLKAIKPPSWAECQQQLVEQISELCQAHAYVLNDPRIGTVDRHFIEQAIAQAATESGLSLVLRRLSRALRIHHGQPVVILIDEYDTPIHAAWLHGYYDQAISFFRTFFGEGLKGNTDLFRGVLTGILRVAKESIFSDLNNLAVYDTLEEPFATAFGFTEAEVHTLAEQAGAQALLPALKDWYDGYRFGDQAIYNPWSLMNALRNAPRPPQPYWRYTSSDSVLQRVLGRSGLPLGQWRALLEGHGIREVVYPSLPLRDLDQRTDALWSFLLFAGYLTASDVDWSGADPIATLRIPNREVRGIYESVFRSWLRDPLGHDEGVDALVQALLRGDADVAAEGITRVLTTLASYHDFPQDREDLYHAFTLGLLARLGADYDVRSNRESGFGRADLLLLPRQPGRPGAVLELKVPRHGQSVDAALDEALAQIERKGYRAALQAAGATPIFALALVYQDRQAHVRVG